METFEQIKSYLLQHATELVIKLVVAFLILLIGWKLVGRLMKILEKGKLFAKLDHTVRSFMTSAIGLVLRVLLIATAAVTLGIPESSFLTLFASCGVAIGLAPYAPYLQAFQRGRLYQNSR